MTFPDLIRRHLESDYSRLRRPFCFLIDSQYRLQDWWGQANAHGFDELHDKEDMAERAPYLVGYLGEAPERLPFVTTGDRTAEVHIIPEDGLYYVVVMDAREAHDESQRRQQIVNELRLLHAAREKLIERQRVLIGDLVEAKTELDHRRVEAERANEHKSQFFAMMSHEFRTPLASIVNYADLALEDDTSADNMRMSAEAISRAARHMNRLVDTVLDEARIEAGQMVLAEAPFDVSRLLDDLATIMAPLAAEKQLSFGVYVDGELPEALLADDACLRQILINLLGNAIKFTESGGVRLNVSWQDDELTAVVTDTGPGIAAADQKRVFDAFQRASSRNEAPGTGLGLTITLGLARLMRGNIDLESEPGSGCRISVTIPAPRAAGLLPDEPALPEPDADAQARRRATVLVCDDDEDLLALAEYYLVRAGYGVLLARDGQEAVEKALASRPDLVLMDINTPRLPGYAAAAELHAQGFAAPIIALTASDVRKLDPGTFSDCLRKPIQMPRLLAAIQTHI